MLYECINICKPGTKLNEIGKLCEYNIKHLKSRFFI
jgi:hypothetical protein